MKSLENLYRDIDDPNMQLWFLDHISYACFVGEYQIINDTYIKMRYDTMLKYPPSYLYNKKTGEFKTIYSPSVQLLLDKVDDWHVEQINSLLKRYTIRKK